MTKKSNLAIQLADSLRKSINQGEYTPGQALPSERELTESTGWSRTTVRRAIQVLVDQGVLQTVQGSGTFVRHSMMQPAAPRMLGLIVPNINNPYYAELAHAIEREATPRGYQMLMGQFRYSISGEANYLLGYAENDSVKGVLVVPDPDNPPIDVYHSLMQKGKPFIFVSRSISGVQVDSVVPDRIHGACELIRYLVGLGHRHIAYIRGIPPEFDSHKQGYERALEDAQIPVNDKLMVSLNCLGEEAGEKGVGILIQSGVSFSAIFARNDITAIGVIRGLRRAGLRVPEDVSVAGFDNTEISSQIQPPLTTVDSAIQEVGRLALSLLLDRVEARYNGPQRQLTIKPNLVLRSSCAQPSPNNREMIQPANAPFEEF